MPFDAPLSDAPAHSVLGNLFRLMSIALQPPTNGLGVLVVSGELAEACDRLWRELELPAEPSIGPLVSLWAYRGRGEEEVLHELRREHTRLFLGSQPLVTNSEGPWRKKAEGKEGVALIVNSYSVEIADFMRRCGVVCAPGYNDCVDYVENEFDFAGWLADEPALLAEKGLDSRSLLARFCDEHIKLWVPGFCDEVAAATRLPYYQALSALVKALVVEL